MSRAASPLYGVTERRRQSDGLEGFIAQGGFAFQVSDDEPEETARYLTVLLNFDSGPHPMAFAQDLRAPMKTVLEHCFLVPWHALHTQASHLLEEYDAAYVNTVVRLPSKSRLQVNKEAAAALVDATVRGLLAAGGTVQDWWLASAQHQRNGQT